jgi:uridylate kinase
MSYKRVLLKISGEQLSGKHEFGIDVEIARYLAKECGRVIQAGYQLVLVVGGGNMVRGAEVAGNGIKRVTADQMGMLSCLINAMAVTDIFESNDIKTRCMSNVFATQVAEAYSYRLAEKHLKRGRVVVVAGGIGRPYFTTDTAALNLALELGCDVVLKATKVDGVYDKDPAKFKDAKFLKEVTFQQAVENPHIKVMDKAALGLAMDQRMPVIIFDPMQSGNILKVTKGESIGTKIG